MKRARELEYFCESELLTQHIDCQCIGNCSQWQFCLHFFSIYCQALFGFLSAGVFCTLRVLILIDQTKKQPEWSGCRTTRPKTNSAHIKLGPCQLGPRCKTGPVPTQPKLSFINRQLVPHFRGIEICVFYHLTARFAPSSLPVRRHVWSFSAPWWDRYQHFRH